MLDPNQYFGVMFAVAFIILASLVYQDWLNNKKED